MTNIAFAQSKPHQATFIVYFNGIEVPAKSVSLRYGVWQTPEMQIDMVADPVIQRLGAEDRVQVVVFYYDDVDVSKETPPQFRLFGEGEITGWGYRNTSSGRSISFTVVDQMSVLDQLFVHFMTSLDDMLGPLTGPDQTTTALIPSSSLVFPFALFQQGVRPQPGQASATITRPFDFLYNIIKAMIGAQMPAEERTVPAANFFARWARLTNFHNKFAASPFFDDTGDNPNIFPVLRALQNVSAVDTICRNLLPNLQNAGSYWNMVQMVYQTMLMEVAMIPGMPLVSVDLATGGILETDFSEHKLVDSFGAWIPALREESRRTRPKRIPSYFAKPQMLFSVPPACNALFPSQIKSLAYEENFRAQPTRLYFNDETVTRVIQTKSKGMADVIHNALAVGWPLEANDALKAGEANPKFHGKNFLLYPEEFFKGPVMDRRDVPPWLFFLEQSKFAATGSGTSTSTTTSGDGAPPAPPTATTTPPAPPRPPTQAPGRIMTTVSNNGFIGPTGQREYPRAVEMLRSKIAAAIIGTPIPLDFALAWVAIESGGDIRSTDTNRPPAERDLGYWQLQPSNARGLRTKKYPQGIQNLADLTNPNSPVAIDAGIEYILFSRQRANQVAKQYGLQWTEGDMWRLTKIVKSGLPAFMVGGQTPGGPFVKGALTRFQETYGRPPLSWEELFFEVEKQPPFGSLGLKALRNATACGGVVPGASGSMVSKSDPKPFTAGAATPAPGTGSGFIASLTQAAQTAAVNATPQLLDDIQRSNLTVHQLYAKYEFFRERYAKRSGSALLAWNPYVVPGFPAALFDQRASSVDVVCYVTTVQQSMSHDGQRSTAISFMYGRQFQEMLDLMRTEFDAGETAAGAAPAEPIRDVRKIVQSFSQAETYYQRLFYGGQRLHDKDAAFDFRKVIGYAPLTDADVPEAIFIEGPDEATQDNFVDAAKNAEALTKARNDATALLAQLQGRINALVAQDEQLTTYAKNGSAFIDGLLIAPLDVEDEIQRIGRQIGDLMGQVTDLKVKLASIDARLNQALTQVQDNQNTSGRRSVVHNLEGGRELVPLPAARSLFESYDAAMRFNWRPICTLDEYIVFHNAAGEGAIPAFGHPQSVGARYFDRIRRFTAPEDGFAPPVAMTGLVGGAQGASPANFPQTRADWDRALLAYRRNVLSVKAPRT